MEDTGGNLKEEVGETIFHVFPVSVSIPPAEEKSMALPLASFVFPALAMLYLPRGTTRTSLRDKTNTYEEEIPPTKLPDTTNPTFFLLFSHL